MPNASWAAGGLGLPQDTQGVSTQEVVVADVLVAGDIYHLQNQEWGGERRGSFFPSPEPNLKFESRRCSQGYLVGDLQGHQHSAQQGLIIIIIIASFAQPGTFPSNATVFL